MKGSAESRNHHDSTRPGVCELEMCVAGDFFLSVLQCGLMIDLRIGREEKRRKKLPKIIGKGVDDCQDGRHLELLDFGGFWVVCVSFDSVSSRGLKAFFY